MEIVLYIIAGLITGAIAMYVFCKFGARKRTSGTLRMYNDPDDGPYLFLELSELPESVMQKKIVTFDVNPRDFVSQK